MTVSTAKVKSEETEPSPDQMGSDSADSMSIKLDEQPPMKKLKTMPNIAEELAKNRSPPLSQSHNNIKKQISISSLLSDPQPSKPTIRAPTVILPSQRPGPADSTDVEKNDILIARINSPVSSLLERSQSNLPTVLDHPENTTNLTKSKSNIDSLLSEKVENNNVVLPTLSMTENSGILKPTPITKPTTATATKDTKAKSKGKQEGGAKVQKNVAKGTKAGSKSVKATKSTSIKSKKDPIKKEPKGKTEIKPKQNSKSKSESPTLDTPAPGSSAEAVVPNTPAEVKLKEELIEGELIDGKGEAKKEKPKKKKTETPRKLVPAPTIKSPKISSVETNGKPIVILDVPLYDVSTNEYMDENGQVVFNVYNMIQEQYGSQLNKAKRNLMVDLNDDVEAAEDNEGEDVLDIDHDGDDDDDDDEEEDEEDEEETSNADPTKNKDVSASPKKKRPNPLKGKSRIGKYDIEDPFIDDSELLWEEQRAATRDGFFVYFGPLIEKGQYASFQRVDGTMKKGGIKNPK